MQHVPSIIGLLIVGLSLVCGSRSSPAQAPVRLLPLGDSITHGMPVPGGYRARLFQLLTAAGYQVDFVGNETSNPAENLPEIQHEGHRGLRIDEISDRIQAWLDQVVDPDVVLLLAGTNDYGQNYDSDRAANRLETLIQLIATHRPFARILVGNLLLRTDDPLKDAAIQATFNSRLPDIVARQANLGRAVHLVDLRSHISAADLTEDGLHPNQAGHDKLADAWYAAICQVTTPHGIAAAPAVAYAFGDLGLATVKVVFNKPVADDATDVARYAFNGGLVATQAWLDPVTQRDLILTTTPQIPSTNYLLSVTGVRDRSPAALPIASHTAVSVLTSGARERGVFNNVSEASDYTLVYSLSVRPPLPNLTSIQYDYDRRSNVLSFRRVGYYLELQPHHGPLHFLWVSVEAFTSDANRVGVPDAASGAFFQQPVTNMNVVSSFPGIVNGTGLAGGNLEFWPNRYLTTNASAVPGARSDVYDWGDQPAGGSYGSMQIHNAAAGQVLMAFNCWACGHLAADLGIGTRSSQQPDWSDAQNAAGYRVKTLQVLVLGPPQARRDSSRLRLEETTAGWAYRYEGLPAHSLSVQRSSDLQSWLTLTNAVSSEQGDLRFEDTAPLAQRGYYRAAVHP